MTYQPITEMIPVGSHCPECLLAASADSPPLPVSEDHPCSHTIHFTTEHGARCGVIARESD